LISISKQKSGGEEFRISEKEEYQEKNTIITLSLSFS